MVLHAKDIMDTNLLTIDDDSDALDCARRMVSARKGYAIVTRGEPGKISGIVTEKVEDAIFTKAYLENLSK